MIVSNFVYFKRLQTNAHLEGWSRITGPGSRVSGDVLDLLQIMRPDADGTGTSRFAQKVMSRVLHN